LRWWYTFGTEGHPAHPCSGVTRLGRSAPASFPVHAAMPATHTSSARALGRCAWTACMHCAHRRNMHAQEGAATVMCACRSSAGAAPARLSWSALQRSDMLRHHHPHHHHPQQLQPQLQSPSQQQDQQRQLLQQGQDSSPSIYFTHAHLQTPRSPFDSAKPSHSPAPVASVQLAPQRLGMPRSASAHPRPASNLAGSNASSIRRARSPPTVRPHACKPHPPGSILVPVPPCPAPSRAQQPGLSRQLSRSGVVGGSAKAAAASATQSVAGAAGGRALLGGEPDGIL